MTSHSQACFSGVLQSSPIRLAVYCSSILIKVTKPKTQNTQLKLAYMQSSTALFMFIPQILNLLLQNLQLVTYNLFKNQERVFTKTTQLKYILPLEDQLINTVITQIRTSIYHNTLEMALEHQAYMHIHGNTFTSLPFSIMEETNFAIWQMWKSFFKICIINIQLHSTVVLELMLHV